MNVSSVKIEKADKGTGWFRMTITSLQGHAGETKIEMLLREETLRQFRNEADRAISNKPRPNTLEVLQEKP
jgi:hypothetical protein